MSGQGQARKKNRKRKQIMRNLLSLRQQRQAGAEDGARQGRDMEQEQEQEQENKA